MNIRRLVFVCGVMVTMLWGCTSPNKVLDRDGPEIDPIVKHSGGGQTSTSAPLSYFAWGGSSRYGKYTRDSINENNLRFPLLPNPIIGLYIHPHLVDSADEHEQYPVPGYMSSFTLYKTPKYALPGQLPPSRTMAHTPFPERMGTGQEGY